ncbi:hypothetical protein EIP91_006085 [Steccherinum ochraceum]|uniref:Uncharacterized protein n=1 Tax=Steccherinum ochraceum TaxID=92696 RepID=A0A4R0R6I4_9APHY|nr:hypothetical protein EIP91_006085 [Steccherinum ochraceum]
MVLTCNRAQVTHLNIPTFRSCRSIGAKLKPTDSAFWSSPTAIPVLNLPPQKQPLVPLFTDVMLSGALNAEARVLELGKTRYMNCTHVYHNSVEDRWLSTRRLSL